MPPTGHFAFFTLIVDDYDKALDYYVGKLGLVLLDDLDLGDKRWVTLAPKGATETRLLLARAEDDLQKAAIGCQNAGRVGFFLHTDDFDTTHAHLLGNGVVFAETPRQEAYGKVAVFTDLYGNRWDLLQLAEPKIPTSI